MLGLMVGDALGSHYEGQTAEWLGSRYHSARALIDHPEKPWPYTDDTQMMIGVCEALIQDNEIVESTLCDKFVANYDAYRGYGYGARIVLQAMKEGHDYNELARTVFEGGSFGNGAAMRVAPVGLLFHREQERLAAEAAKSATPTHVHPLGIEGARLLAAAVAHCVARENFDRTELFELLLASARSPEFHERLSLAANPDIEIARLGNGIAALDSVVTAIACFASAPNSFEHVVTSAIFLGGDTDTIAAMAGAVSGAFVGRAGIPEDLIAAVEDHHKGVTYVAELSQKLHAAFWHS